MLAFVGDQRAGPQSETVLRHVGDEGTDLIALQEDYGYDGDTVARAALMDRLLGAGFSVFGVAGNRDKRDR